MILSKISLRLGLFLNLVIVNACFGLAGCSDPDSNAVPNDWETFERRLFSPDPKEQMAAFFQQGISMEKIPVSLAPKVAARFEEIAKTNGPSGLGVFAIMSLGGLGAWASNSVPYLESVAMDPQLDYTIRNGAYDSLSTITTNAVFKARIVEAFLQSRSDRVCQSGLRAIRAVPPADYQSKFCVLLTEILNTRTNVSRSSVIEAMGYVAEGHPEIVATLKAQLASKDPASRAWAIAGLDRGNFLKRDDMVVIGKLLSDDDSRVRYLAIQVLAGCGTNALPALPYLEAAVASTNADPAVARLGKHLVTKLRTNPEK